MNTVILMGRLTRDPEVRYTQGPEPMAVARWSLAVDRRYKKNGEQETDFISCVAFGKTAELVEKYCHKGMKICVSGRIQTGSYTNKDGIKVYTTDVIVDNVEFAESKAASQGGNGNNQNAQNNNRQQGGGNNGYGNNSYGNNSGNNSYGGSDGFMNIPDGIDEELPFN